MTIGQRIAEQRKKLGLSQEALGEKLGVSRQAISKWESDASVPEIDKLIVLSKLFGVSVGWLLGVEEPQEKAGETTAETQQPLRKAVTDWLKGWELPSAEPEAKGSRLRKLFRWLTPKRLGIVLLVVVQLLMCLELVRCRNLANSAQIYAQIAKNTAETAQFELKSLQESLAREEEAAPGGLLSSYSFDFDPAKDSLKATVTFSAVPYSWQAEAVGYLCISGRGIPPMEIPCQWDGAFLRCAAVLDLAGEVQLCFAVEYGDGSRQLQLLSAPELENADFTQPPIVSGRVDGIKYDAHAKAVLLKGLDVNFHRSDAYADTAITWQTQAILLLADREEVARLNHFDANTHPHDSSLVSGGSGFYAREKLLPNVVLTEGQTVELVLYAELSNGLSAQETIAVWTVGANGTLLAA